MMEVKRIANESKSADKGQLKEAIPLTGPTIVAIAPWSFGERDYKGKA
jgi:hypothetical protein